MFFVLWEGEPETLRSTGLGDSLTLVAKIRYTFEASRAIEM